jgi:hypothetical protein
MEPRRKRGLGEVRRGFLAWCITVSLFPAARPVRRQTLDAFIARMNGVAQGSLRSFEEKTLGMQVLVFGNVSVVLAASEMLENGTEVNHDVSGVSIRWGPHSGEGSGVRCFAH